MRFWQPLFPLIPAHLWCLSLKDVNLGLSFILLQHFSSATWFKQFIHHRRQLYFHPTGMSLTVCERAAKIRPVTGYRRGLLHTPCLPSSSPCMAWLDDSLPPGSSRKIPPSSAEQRPWRRSGKKVKTTFVHFQTKCHTAHLFHTLI